MWITQDAIQLQVIVATILLASWEHAFILSPKEGKYFKWISDICTLTVTDDSFLRNIQSDCFLLLPNKLEFLLITGVVGVETQLHVDKILIVDGLTRFAFEENVHGGFISYNNEKFL